MKKRKLMTRKEYDAKAMLLGAVYEPKYHHMRKSEMHGQFPTVWYMDPDTLAPLTGGEAWDLKRTQLRGPKS